MKTKILPLLMISFVALSIMGVVALERVNSNPELKDAINEVRGSNLFQDVEAVEEKFMEHIPESYESTLDIIAQNENRFILWTHDGENIMWGTYGNNHFTAEDNNGEKVWGVYNNGFFAGVYGDQFFYGKYGRNQWKAYGLFGEKRSFGGFKLFSEDRPTPLPRPYDKPQKIDKPHIAEHIGSLEGPLNLQHKKPLRKNLLNGFN